MDADTFKLPTSLDGKHKFAVRKPPANKPPSPPAHKPPPPAEPELQADQPTSAHESSPTGTADTAAAPIEAAPIAKTPVRPPRTPQPQCSYVEPKWSAAPAAQHPYHIEMLKSGTIVETVSDLQEQAYWLIGKLPDNHIVMAHPTVSRFHAVLQYRPDVAVTQTPPPPPPATADEEAQSNGAPNSAAKPRIECGWYLYDLDSTHGSFVNKRKIPARTYVRVRVGYMLSFGGSTRRLILQGPDFDAEAESELGITEQREQRAQQKAAAAELVRVEREQREEEERKREAAGATWGMQEDADEETDLSVNPYASTNNEELFLQDPKRTLRGYFEREGLELEYRVDELSTGSFVCKIDLPISDSNGRPIRCEVSHKGKKKECVVQGALEACRILDRHGVLRQSHHESRKRKVEHSDSDGDDDFYDRTGAVERKREEKDAVQQTKAFTYAELLDQERELLAKQADVDARIEAYQLAERRTKQLQTDGGAAASDHDLDGFMAQLASDGASSVDKTTIRRLRVEAKEIEADHRRLQRLISIARPANLPPLLAVPAAGAERKKLSLPLFGKRGTFKFVSSPVVGKVAEKTAATLPPVDDQAVEVDEVEDVVAEEHQTGAESPIAKPKVVDDMPAKRRKAAPAEQLLADVPQEDVHVDDARSVDTTEDPEAAAAAAAELAAAKKKRSRPRIRGERPRDNIDMDEPAELVANSDKYSTWVPPTDQSGDGSTSLNDKFGY